jgi:hypothetical protein
MRVAAVLGPCEAKHYEATRKSVTRIGTCPTVHGGPAIPFNSKAPRRPRRPRVSGKLTSPVQGLFVMSSTLTLMWNRNFQTFKYQ